MRKTKPVSVEVVEEAGGRFVISTHADGEIVREAVVPKKAPIRRPRRPRQRLKRDRMNRTWKKSF
jgi:hypothetical protein